MSSGVSFYLDPTLPVTVLTVCHGISNPTLARDGTDCLSGLQADLILLIYAPAQKVEVDA